MRAWSGDRYGHAWLNATTVSLTVVESRVLSASEAWAASELYSRICIATLQCCNERKNNGWWRHGGRVACRSAGLV